MLRTYGDITSRLGTPLWWDDQGVPRYDPFSPYMMGVYDRAVAYQRINCQACHREFRVAVSDNPMFSSQARPYPTQELIGHWHFGDPPSHRCVGDTMNSEPIAIVEFWTRSAMKDWQRHAEHEFIVDPVYADTP